MKRIQQRIYELLEVANPDDTASRFTDLFLFVLIALNVIAVIVETVEDRGHTVRCRHSVLRGLLGRGVLRWSSCCASGRVSADRRYCASNQGPNPLCRVVARGRRPAGYSALLPSYVLAGRPPHPPCLALLPPACVS